MTAMGMIPDLTRYSKGLGSDTFPLKVSALHDTAIHTDSNNNSLEVSLIVVTLEQRTTEIMLDGQGFHVVSFALPPLQLDNQLSTRQQEALSGFVYETIEALLMAISPGFEAFFGQELANQLENVSWDQNRFHYSDDDDDDEAQ
ncbi:hypothetical protein FBU30_006249 [Linnemannia zychae]|nr:hypothetical protein FBU30_006249 [Linnemannia zychae]